MICYFKKTFLKDLTEVTATYRKKIEKMVFEDIPLLQHITDKIDLKKIKGYENYYRIRIGATGLVVKYRQEIRSFSIESKIERTFIKSSHDTRFRAYSYLHFELSNPLCLIIMVSYSLINDPLILILCSLATLIAIQFSSLIAFLLASLIAFQLVSLIAFKPARLFACQLDSLFA